MWHVVNKKKIPFIRLAMFAALLAVIGPLGSCNKSDNAMPKKEAVQKDAPQKTFASSADAGTAFLDAAKSGTRADLIEIFGPQTKDVLFSGDAVKDKADLADFVAAYNQMHRWREIKAGGQVLYAGADNFPFPIPLGQNASGRWYFDTAAGKDEILARRIGKDELTAMAALGAVFDAQQQYFVHSGKQYAQKFISEEGQQNGLYWAVSEGQAPSPLDEVRDFARTAGYTSAGNNPQPFSGYYFRILTKQGDKAKGGAKDYLVSGKLTGGFAVLAYPAEYRNSGIMTFMVGSEGVIYQKDLGDKTKEAAAMTEYNPGDGWSPAI
jgi:hypothetical protein